MLAPGGEIHEESDFARLLIRSLGLYPAYVAELTEATGVDIDFSICGAIETIAPDAPQSLTERLILQQSLGIALERISPSEIYYPGDGYVDPVDVIAALRVALQRTSVTVREHTRVARIRTHASGVEVDGIPGGAAVIAAGAWSNSIAVEGAVLPRAYPVKGHLLGYELAPGSIPAIRRGGHAYIVQRASGFTVVGASQEDAGFDKSIDADVAATVRRGGEAVLPALRGIEPSRVWTGLRPAAKFPLYSRLSDSNVWLAYGHFRNGILSAPATADHLAASIAGDLTSISETDLSVPGSSL
jgi:glycine oxidase